MSTNGSRLKTFPSIWAAAWLAAASAFGQANVYVLDLAWKELAFTNRPALGETAEIELRGIGSSDPTNLTIYLSNRAGDMLAVTEGMTATGDYARAELALNTTNLLAEFDGVSTAGSRDFDFTVWDAARSRLLASAKIEVRHNPLWESLAFTNLPALEDLGLSEYLVWGAMGTNETPSVTYTIDLATKNLTADGRVAVGERAAILLKNIGDAQPAGILLYLSTKSGTGLALQAGLSATTNAGEALGVLNLATTNLVGEFADSGPTAEKALNLSIWDSSRDRLLASQPIPVRNNPLAAQFVDGWTNLPEEVAAELEASIAAAYSAATNAYAIAMRALGGDISFGTAANIPYRGDWGYFVSNNLVIAIAGVESNAESIVAVGAVASNATDNISWRVWNDSASNVYAVAADGTGSQTNTSFSALMNGILNGASANGVVIELANTTLPNGDIRFFEIDAPIIIESNICAHVRGAGGTHVSIKDNYDGRLFVVGNTVKMAGQTRFSDIAFVGGRYHNSANTNAFLDFANANDVEVRNCYFSCLAGSAIRVGAALQGAQYNIGIRDNWIYSERNAHPSVELLAPSGANAIWGADIEGNYFVATTSVSCIEISGGYVRGVNVRGNIFNKYGYYAGTGIVFRSGYSHVVSENQFIGFNTAAKPIAFLPPSSNDFRSIVSGNAFGYSTSTNGIWVAADAHGVSVVANSMPQASVKLDGANVGGYVANGYGTNSYSFVRGDWFRSVSNLTAEAYGLAEEAHGWGDHAGAGYLTEETDPAWSAASNLYATKAESTNIAQAVVGGWTFVNGFTNADGMAITFGGEARTNWPQTNGISTTANWASNAAVWASNKFATYVQLTNSTLWKFGGAGVDYLYDDDGNGLHFDDGIIYGTWNFYDGFTVKEEKTITFGGVARTNWPEGSEGIDALTATSIAQNVVGGWTFDSYRKMSPAVISDGTAYIWCESNSIWDVNLVGNDGITNGWTISTNGWSPGDLISVVLKVSTDDSFGWSWPLGCVTNVAAPTASSTNLYLLIHNGSAWCAY